MPLNRCGWSISTIIIYNSNTRLYTAYKTPDNNAYREEREKKTEKIEGCDASYDSIM